MAHSLTREHWKPAAAAGLSAHVSTKELTGLAAVGTSTLAAFLLLLGTGGSPSPLNHFGYIPVMLGTYLWGRRGGILGGLFVSLALGPVLSALDLEGNGEPMLPWLYRGAAFTGIGFLVGTLFDRSRAAATGWRSTATELIDQQRESMLTLARAAETKDPTTGDHMYRCRDLATVLAREVGFAEARVADIGWSAMLHDIGKLYVPDHVLVKPGELSPEEWALIRMHPGQGADLLDGPRMFETARRIARWHHENLDGTGYPDGLRGNRIPLEARIVRIVDAWDAMTNDRPYRLSLGHIRAMEELVQFAGTQFDPELVALFLRYLERDARARVA
ncbi:MAG: HD-GYP domain-containing protein [Chloroflexota bacterium]